MAFAVPLAGQIERLPWEARRLLALLLVPAGLLLAWRASLARGESCASGPTPDAFACVTWEAWYRWPGVAAGLLLVLVACAALVALRRDAAKLGSLR